MNKQDLIVEVASEMDIPKAQAERTVNTVLDTIKKGVKNDGSVTLVNFGTFVARTRKARTARNPRTGESIAVPARKTVGFRPGRDFKNLI